MRFIQESLCVVLVLTGAWLWLGASGAAMVGLWFLTRADRRSENILQVDDLTVILSSPKLSFVHLTPYRIVLGVRGLGRIEVFRDEMSPADWARLRRGCLSDRPPASQPASPASQPASPASQPAS